MAYIRNIEQDAVLNLADQVQVRPGEVVSRTLAQNDAVSMTLFAFAEGEEISTHASKGDAFVLVLSGTGCYTVGGTDHALGAGETIVMPAGIPHAIRATSDLKWLLVVVFPEKEEA